MMTKTLDCVLLIDDSVADNYFHRMVIERAGCAKKVIVKQSAREALEYLKSRDTADYPKPDLIFLDINMPGMNGWEFLEEYQHLDKDQQGKMVIVMLTTSLNPDDEEHARKIKVISGFEKKPLSSQALMAIIERNFV